MNTAKLVNSALTGGGLIYPENLNVIIGSEDHGYPKGYVLDANASLGISNSSGSGTNTDNTFLNSIKYYNDNNKSTFSLDFNDAAGIRNNLSMRSSLLTEPSVISKGYANIMLGDYIFNRGNRNIFLGGSQINKGNGNILLSNSIYITVKYKKIDNNNLIVYAKKNSDGRFLINNKCAIFSNAKYKDDKIIIEDKAPSTIIYNVNIIDDDSIKITSNNIGDDFQDTEGDLLLLSQSNYGVSNIISGYAIVSNSKKTLMSGSLLYSGNMQNGAAIGTGIKINNNCEIGIGAYNLSKVASGVQRIVFSIGCGNSDTDRSNAVEVRRSGDLYIQNIGGFDGKNSDTAKSLQQVISEIQNNSSSATQPVVDNGPWDVDITSRFTNGNVTIKPLSPWTINPAYKRVYFEADLKQGDIITIPDSLRMYVGWKISDNKFGMEDWNAAAKKYTVTTDSKYVILVDTPSTDNPGVQVDTLSSFGRIMLHTSNEAFKPNSGGGSQTPGTTQTVVLPKDHTRDDRVMKSIAHQGYHTTEKANSLAAFRAAAKEGWQYVETDIYKTSDNNWVVGHDAWMPEGYTNGTITIASGDHSYKYEEHTLAEIRAFTSPDNNKVATLQEFCKVCKQSGLHPYIEIKNPNMGGRQTGVGDKYDNKPYVHKALDIIRREGLGKNFTIISSGNWNLEETVKYDNNIRVGYINVFEMYNVGTDVNKKYWDTVTINLTKIINAGMGRAVYLFLDQNLTHVATCPAENMDWLMDKKIALEVWTAKTENDLNNLDPYITGVTCDNIHAGEILAKKI